MLWWPWHLIVHCSWCSNVTDLRSVQNDAHIHSVAKAGESGFNVSLAIEQPSMENDGHFVFFTQWRFTKMVITHSFFNFSRPLKMQLAKTTLLRTNEVAFKVILEDQNRVLQHHQRCSALTTPNLMTGAIWNTQILGLHSLMIFPCILWGVQSTFISVNIVISIVEITHILCRQQ